MKTLLTVVVIAGLAGGGWYYWNHHYKTTAALKIENEKPPTATLARGVIARTVSTTGRVVSNRDVEIKCKASGEVVNLPFDVSDTVKKGDLIVQIDPVEEQRRVRQAEAQLKVVKARVELARLTLQVAERDLQTETARADAALDSATARAKDTRAKAERARELFKTRDISQEALDTLETQAIQAEADRLAAEIRMEEIKTRELTIAQRRQDVLLAEAQLETEQLSVELASQRLEDTRVISPIDGVVASRNAQIGQIVASGVSNVGGGTTMMVLSDLTAIFVFASVDESDIGKIAVDQPAMVTADAYPDEIFRGKVVRVGTKGKEVSNVVTFEVQIEVRSPNKGLLKQEMTANVEIISERHEDALLAPIEAVVRQKGKQIAFLVKADGSKEEREVKTGIDDGVQIEIVEGLAEGDTVEIRKDLAQSRFRPGMMGEGAGKAGEGKAGEGKAGAGGMPRPPAAAMMKMGRRTQ